MCRLLMLPTSSLSFISLFHLSPLDPETPGAEGQHLAQEDTQTDEGETYCLRDYLAPMGLCDIKFECEGDKMLSVQS